MCTPTPLGAVGGSSADKPGKGAAAEPIRVKAAAEFPADASRNMQLFFHDCSCLFWSKQELHVTLPASEQSGPATRQAGESEAEVLGSWHVFSVERESENERTKSWS